MANVHQTQTTERKTNRLSREKSPYLLQHQYNPVDWFAWGDNAFAKALRESKPVFLSIGYSTCHWCHVMERETFENEMVGAFLNEHFVSIKVDREERPDVDKIYMTFVQATVGQGGWPLNVFLTPDRKPFFGGTYFPPDNRHGRPGFLQLIRHIQELWSMRRDEVTRSAADIHEQLGRFTGPQQSSEEVVGPKAIRNAGEVFKKHYDPRNGGFGTAPKFPQPSQPQLLLRYALRFSDEESRRMVLHTCDKMAAGGIHDQLGGGFSRYSVDAEWLVPHFEKMLYDNAQLAHLYLDAWLVSGDARYANTCRDVLHYVLRDMTHPEGGFYSAEDADSEGHEGKFYCWTRGELQELLSPEEFKAAVRHFGITEQGNFVDHSHPEPLPGQNVLSVVDPNLAEVEKRYLAAATTKMLAARLHRIRPHLDDKVLASWNGLMLGAMGRASAVLGEPRYRVAAEKNLAFIHSRLWDASTRTLHHRWRDGQRDGVQLLESYAFMLCGVIDVYESTLDPAHLEFAVAIATRMIDLFFDREHGGFWQSPPGTPDLILQVKEDYDGAEPSGNSVAMLGLLRLGKITGRSDFTDAAEKSIRLFAARLEQLPQAVPHMLQALDFSLQEPQRVVITGNPALAETQALLHAAHSVYQPNKVVLGTAGPVEPFANSVPVLPEPVAYVCTGTECRPPTKSPAALRELLSA